MPPQTGISEQTLTTLFAIFARYPEIEAARLYGSRAKGNFGERSDIDLALFGDQLDRHIVSAAMLDIDASDIPLLVDLQNYHDIQNQKLRDHIDRVGITLYQARSAP